MTWPKPVRRRIRRLLADVAAECSEIEESHCTPDTFRFLQGAARDAMDLLRATEERAPKPMKLERKRLRLVEKQEADDEWCAIKEQVLERAGGRCEGCNRESQRLSVDHWEGGVGRRRENQSVETCWALCPFCDHERTHNRPSAAHWNLVRESHCFRYGYAFKPHKELINAPR